MEHIITLADYYTSKQDQTIENECQANAKLTRSALDKKEVIKIKNKINIALEILDDHDLLEESDKLKQIAKECSCSHCRDFREKKPALDK